MSKTPPKEKELTDEYITSLLPEPEKSITLKAGEALTGQTIVGCRYLTKAEADETKRGYRTFALFLENGTVIYPSSDDEGIEAGALYTTHDDLPIIPALPNA